jgi:tRNA threonylcarbamoyladenosine biosynthesis protein TsaE
MIVKDEAALIKLGQVFGGKLRGGEVVELIGDIGAGKTTFVKGIAQSLGVKTEVNSPSFAVMKEYSGEINNVLIYLKHYDFYRLDDAGLMKNEIIDSVGDENTITVVEWAKDIAGVLPPERLKVKINYLPDSDGREVVIEGEKS